MADSYKSSKEAFVSGMTGSTVGHINMVSAVAMSSIALHSALKSRLPISKSMNFATEWLLLVAPMLLSLTLFASSPGLLSLILLFPTGLLLLIPARESGTPLPSSSDYFLRPSSSASIADQTMETSSSSSGSPLSAIPPLPSLTVYRAHMMIMTILSILAVDFPVFPRSLAKCETFGVSIMDLGVGSFVFSQGVVSAIPLLKDPAYLYTPLVPKATLVIRKTLPVLLLGLVRVILVKGTDYPEHVSEYGAHWNFFITLALLPVLQVLLHPLIANMSIALLGAILAFTQQWILSTMGSEEFVLFAPRTNLFSANKEGIFSLPGYLAIHLLGLSTGTLLLPPSPNYFRRQLKALASRRRRDSNAIGHPLPQSNSAVSSIHRENDKTATELCSYAAVWWILMGACYWTGIGGGVSRRLVNLPYILWVAAYNTTFLLGYLLLDLFFFPSPLSKSTYSPTSKLKVPKDSARLDAVGTDHLIKQLPKAPALLEAINKNGLALFLLANVATGLTNLMIPTMYTSDIWAMVVLGGYALGVCGVAWTFRKRRIWRM
ncbi:hypothetical protein JAAARDRAFT_163439 [Jaapia argillacea MUCL 33604]|uniref:GPI-anchored wall transfer protein n=1 Tax=Jaapia argillacea MUCL 33604 TaxID=933084 RepID=A0A067PKW6_9AGAM|nr:hypothetical protein JAAARDRAFT_163439 [Jaapia argillacea MUCL 33604]